MAQQLRRYRPDRRGRRGEESKMHLFANNTMNSACCLEGYLKPSRIHGYVQNDGGSLAPLAGKGDVPGRGRLFRGRGNADTGFSRQPLGDMVW